MRPGEAPTSWPRRPFASTLSPHRFRRLTEARHSYHGRSASHAPQPFLYLLFPYAIMPSPDACGQCVATLSRNEQKNARHDGTMARWHDGTMARWHDGRILKQSIGPVPFHGKMAEICGCERWFCERGRKREFRPGVMLSESVDSTEIEPNDRSQPQISAIFPYLGTRFSQVEWAFHKKWTPACASAQNQTSLPTGHSMAAPQMGPAPDKEDPATASRKKFRAR